MENTAIEWASHTFNPWKGCTKVSPGCANCYAETLSHRNPKTLGVWGPKGTRSVAAESAWKVPLKWDRQAAGAMTVWENEGGPSDRIPDRPRVFCASLADVFEDWPGPMTAANGTQLWKRADGSWTTSDHYRDTVMLTMQDVRRRLFALIHKTPHLDWLLLTKRPENLVRFAGCNHCQGPWKPPHADTERCACGGTRGFPPNVWLGTSVENQATADERIPHLLRTPAAVRFLSCEPLLGPVDVSEWLGVVLPSIHCRDNYPRDGVNWVIVGGESGAGSRSMQVEWARDLVRRCQAADVPVFVKQLGAVAEGDYYDDREAYELSGYDWPDPIGWNPRDGQPAVGSRVKLPLLDRKGGDIEEWPHDLRVREFPVASR